MKKKNTNKIISYAVNQMGTHLSESVMNDYFFGGDNKPTCYISTDKIKKTMEEKGIEVDVPKAKYICSFQKRLKALEELDLDI